MYNISQFLLFMIIIYCNVTISVCLFFCISIPTNLQVSLSVLQPDCVWSVCEKYPLISLCFIFAVTHFKNMMFFGLLTNAIKRNSAICRKMHLKEKKHKKPMPQERGNKSPLEGVKEDEDMFRHRIESLPGNRPNSKSQFTMQFIIIYFSCYSVT